MISIHLIRYNSYTLISESNHDVHTLNAYYAHYSYSYSYSCTRSCSQLLSLYYNISSHHYIQFISINTENWRKRKQWQNRQKQDRIHCTEWKAFDDKLKKMIVITIFIWVLNSFHRNFQQQYFEIIVNVRRVGKPNYKRRIRKELEKLTTTFKNLNFQFQFNFHNWKSRLVGPCCRVYYWNGYFKH